MSPVVPVDEVLLLDLEQQKKRAKELQRALANDDTDALRRFRKFHPKSEGLTDAQIVERLAKVSEAQLVIARELGLTSWPRLRRHVLRHTAARAEVAAGATRLDGDVPTTHIRCGSDIRGGLVLAGLTGTFVEVNDPYCQGPVPRDGDLPEIRARFLASAYDVPLDVARGDVARIDRDLHASRAQARVVLWFEHDSFDQLILARVLAFYGQHGSPRRLELVHVDGFPAVDRFKGLGELSAAALRMLWDDRRPVTPELIALGSRMWEALREHSPMALHAQAHASDALPQMGRAVLRHLQELPWTNDGLSLTQRLALQSVAAQPASAGRVFVRLMNELEPLPYLGDSMFWVILKDLLAASPAPIAMAAAPTGKPWHQGLVTLTDAGRRVLSADLDFLSCRPPERWVGGVPIVGAERTWRWDQEAGRPTRDE